MTFRAANRLVILLIGIIFSGFFISAIADTKSVDASHQYNVIIIGAGSAGLGAAQYLYQHDVKNVLVIEARDRIGGRVWTTLPWGTATDLGASWIMYDDNSPFTLMAKKYKVNTIRTAYDTDLTSKFSSFDMYDNNGKKITSEEMKSGLALIEKFNRNVSQNKIHFNINTSMQDAYATFAKQEKLQGKNLQIFNFMVKDMIESEAAGDLNQVSLSTASSMHSQFSGHNVLPQGGYIRLFSELVKNISISLNNPVTAINYGQQGVTMVTKKGVYHAKYVVVTLPLGVLQAGAVKFTPDLPKEKLASIKRMHMGYFNKIYLLFNKQFWNTDSEWIAMMPNMHSPKAHYEALNLYKYVKQPILLFFSAGSFSKDMEGWADAKIIDDVMHHLKLIYGSNIPSPSAYLITRWGKDPFARGSYSYPSVGSSIEDYKTLAATVANKLFFAGEATSWTDPSTVHGAYMSGVRAAEQIMQQLSY